MGIYGDGRLGVGTYGDGRLNLVSVKLWWAPDAEASLWLLTFMPPSLKSHRDDRSRSLFIRCIYRGGDFYLRFNYKRWCKQRLSDTGA